VILAAALTEQAPRIATLCEIFRQFSSRSDRGDHRAATEFSAAGDDPDAPRPAAPNLTE
jgi:hypothetical protein